MCGALQVGACWKEGFWLKKGIEWVKIDVTRGGKKREMGRGVGRRNNARNEGLSNEENEGRKLVMVWRMGRG